MTACPRPGCGGSLLTIDDRRVCHLCSRTVPPARPPTAKEAGDKRLEKPNVTDYYSGVYAVDYEPSPEEEEEEVEDGADGLAMSSSWVPRARAGTAL